MNYPYDFIDKCWEDEKYLTELLKRKFDMYYKKVGACGVIPEFYVNLSKNHQIKLAKWVDKNTNFC